MKKSKIIVPALGLLLLSTAASVSGTVAWFTANRTYDTSISNIAVVSTTGSLKGTFESGVGTTASTDSIAVTSGAVLTHGSLNHTNKLVSWPTDDSAQKFGSYTIAAAGSDSTADFATHSGTDATSGNLLRLVDDKGNSVYSAFTWKMTLTYTTSNVTDVYGLFFDNANSVVTKTSAASATKETYKGFRLALIGAEETMVWADNQVEAKCAYVSAVDGTSHAAAVTGTWSEGVQTATGYADETLIASDTATGKIASLAVGGIEDGSVNETGAQAYRNYLGKFVAPAAGEGVDRTKRTLSFLCVAWFEGTDENVITAASMDTVRAGLFFETRRLA